MGLGETERMELISVSVAFHQVLELSSFLQLPKRGETVESLPILAQFVAEEVISSQFDCLLWSDQGEIDCCTYKKNKNSSSGLVSH